MPLGAERGVKSNGSRTQLVAVRRWPDTKHAQDSTKFALTSRTRFDRAPQRGSVGRQIGRANQAPRMRNFVCAGAFASYMWSRGNSSTSSSSKLISANFWNRSERRKQASKSD